MIPAKIRSNSSWLILFRLNPIDFENVYKDVVMLPLQKWNALLESVYRVNENSGMSKESKRYDFLSVFVDYDMFFKDF